MKVKPTTTQKVVSWLRSYLMPRQSSEHALCTVLELQTCAMVVVDFLGWTDHLQASQQLPLVCKRLAAVCLNSMLETVHTVIGVKSGDTLQWLSLRCPHLKTLELSHPMCMPSQWKQAGALNSGLYMVAMWCKKLAKVNLEGHISFDSPALSRLVSKSPYLTDLNVAKCTAVNDEVMLQLLHHCPHLRRLSVSRCENITDEGFASGILAVRARKNWAVQALDVSHTAVGDSSLNGIAAMSQLKSLDLAGCTKVTDTGFSIIGKACPLLNHVNLSRTACTDLTVSLLAHGPQQLEHLDVSHTTCTDLGILQIAALCQGTLTELECSWVNGVTDVSILAVARVCHRLVKLFVRDCFFVTEVSMEALARLLPKCQVFDG